jgi:NAD(P)-dependent dehydrogenase (short-subunit alcohol dehydrogenase family)
MAHSPGRLEGRIAFITGASSGIGAAAMRLFATEGAVVVGAARRMDRMEAVVADLRDAGLQADAILCDVREESSVRAAVSQVVARHGRIDCAFNNAGIIGSGLDLHEVPVETYGRRNIRVNAIAPGGTQTEMHDNLVARMATTNIISRAEARDLLASRNPLGGIARPEHMAQAALFLLCDESRWTTGTVLPCEGGMSID